MSVPDLPLEFAAFASLLDAQPEPVRAAFHYCLALVMVEAKGKADRKSGQDSASEAECRAKSVKAGKTGRFPVRIALVRGELPIMLL
jgi:hypothetical protein